MSSVLENAADATRCYRVALNLQRDHQHIRRCHTALRDRMHFLYITLHPACYAHNRILYTVPQTPFVHCCYCMFWSIK
jgi:hypothetical protein